MGSQFRASGLGWPALAPGPPLCGLLRANQERHALGNGDRKGVLGSFRDFMQGQVTCGINPNWGKAKGRGHICGDANGRVSLGFGEVENEPSQTPMWPQVSSKGGHTSKGGVRLLLPSQAAGQPGFGKGDGMPRRTRDEGPGKREQECLLGRGKLSSWGMTAAVAQQRLQGPAATPTPRNGIGGRDMPSPGPIAHGLAAGAHPEGKKGSFAKALEVARCKNRLGQALKDLNKGFWTSSTAAVKKSRREEVLKLAREVSGRREVLPLDRQTVEHVAAALKAGGLASADQYLNELKLLHVEAGYCLEAWLSRTFQLCKKSVARERGPVRRAPEVDLDELPAEGWDRLQDLAVPLGAWAYAWGVAWMLREIELSKVRWEHVTWNRAAKTVRLFIPHSKMDQKGLGVARTLQCCGETPCWKGCAWNILQKLLELRGRRAGHPEEMMFPNLAGNKPSKHEMVSSWRTLVGGNIAGHSARRSGAMAYVRRGLGIKELAFLGRWRSSVVLTYAEEALETTPANMLVTRAGVEGTGAPGTPCPGTPARIIMTPVVEVKQPGDGRPAAQVEVTRPKAKTLWVKSTERGGANPLHFIVNADWSLPMKDWSTSCGWSFAKRSARISFATDPPLNALKCKKCVALKGLRDDVSGGCSPAQMIAADIKQLSAKNKMHGKEMPHFRPCKKRRVEGGS